MNFRKPKIVPFSHAFQIKATSRLNQPFFLNAIQQIVDSVIPEELWLETKHSHDPEAVYQRLESMLPIFTHSSIDNSSDTLLLTYLCSTEYTHLARRYIADTIGKYLIPGKYVEMTGGMSLNFQFVREPSHQFFVLQEMISIRNEEDFLSIRKNLNALILELKQKLSCEFLKIAENVVHPIFMPRNEEELIRNLIDLSKQINYVTDLPQVSIHYEKQTDQDLTFTVLIARLLRGTMEPLKKVLERCSIKMDIDDIRIMSYLKQKHPKEAAIIRLTVDKFSFFRQDLSVDLLKARQKIVSEVTHCLGEFRDFNGGMILKKDEALKAVRRELGEISEEKEFLLENYFYSLRPGIMQSIHDASLLKKHFELLVELLQSDFSLKRYTTVEESVGKYHLQFVGALDPNFKKGLLNAIAPLEISSRDLTTSSLQIDDKTILGFILRAESQEIVQNFQKALINSNRLVNVVKNPRN